MNFQRWTNKARLLPAMQKIKAGANAASVSQSVKTCLPEFQHNQIYVEF
jgi:hypothetical protein